MSQERKKRVATSAPQDEPPSKRADIDEEDDSPSEEAIAHAKHLFDRRSPVTGSTPAEIVRKITLPIPEGWSDDDEAVISGYWDASSAKTHSAKINQGRHAPLLALFKTSIRVVGLAPITMISPIHCLRHQPVSRDNSGIESIYSHTVSALLTSLVVHPGFGRNRHHIIWALQYGVMCRLDDRLAWPHEQYRGYCPALGLVSQRIGNSEAPESIHAMHKSARDEVIAHGDRNPNPWSDFLYHLGETVASHRSSRPPVVREFRKYGDFDVLPVTLWDLQTLEKAVDTMEWPDEDMRYPVSEAWEAWKDVRKGRDVPSIKQLPEMFELLHKDIYRQCYSRDSPAPLSEQNESADENPQPSSPVDEDLTNEIGTGNDHNENVLPDSEHCPLDGQAGSGEDMMVPVTDDVASETGFPTPLSSALQPSLNIEINKRLDDFMEQQRKITLALVKQNTDLHSKIKNMEVQLVDKQKQIDSLSNARRKADEDLGKLSDDQYGFHHKILAAQRHVSLLQNQVAAIEDHLGISQSQDPNEEGQDSVEPKDPPNPRHSEVVHTSVPRESSNVTNPGPDTSSEQHSESVKVTAPQETVEFTDEEPVPTPPAVIPSPEDETMAAAEALKSTEVANPTRKGFSIKMQRGSLRTIGQSLPQQHLAHGQAGSLASHTPPTSKLRQNLDLEVIRNQP
ncbi:hypothetical protein FNAPI_9691 [Fusarium napiforme]|uniref:Uncharacterized protein n=1 Tax=Fusarium napiforme TaxID=42672 RepID=A0A8H5MW52_9HYPO|nr:hypothetical protein FNAPI_9691 [Fusarium napiforme]